ncbi:MAG: hypothetical protein KBT36_01585 [Kurthia sp.]|nr:hypothetical protein [Candidatus Kurthia equi]
MFRIKSEELKLVVGKFAGAYRNSLVKDTCVTVATSKTSQIVSISFVANGIAVQERFTADVTADGSFNTSMSELSLKVSILPEEVYISFEPKGTNYTIRWGRGNGILLRVQADEVLPFPIPKKSESISFAPGKWEHFTRFFTPFCSKRGEEIVNRLPITLGVNFKKIPKVGMVASATNSSKIIQNSFDVDWFSTEVTIARDTFQVVSCLTSSKDIMELSLDDSKGSIIVETSTTTVIASLLDGDFPNIEQFLGNEQAEIVWRTDRLELLEVARRVKRLAPDKCAIDIFKKDNKYFATLKGVLTEQIGSVIETEVEAGMRLSANCLEAALTVLRSEEVLLTLSKEKLAHVTIFSGDPQEDGETDNLKVVLGQVKEV